MSQVRIHGRTAWEQWDLQEDVRIAWQMRVAELVKQDQAYIELNNLYLQVERGEVRMSVKVSNDLRVLAGQAYDKGDAMIDWWMTEFTKLPRWLDF